MAAKSELDKIQSGYGGKIWAEYIGDIAVMHLDRGENRMNNQLLDGINRCLDEILDKRPEVRALVTTSKGKFYSNGLDLNWMKEISSIDDVNAFLRNWHGTLKRILTLPIPTISAINGHAFAGGAFLTLCHDYRVMQSGRGWWSINEVHLGMKIPQWLIKLATFKIPHTRAQTDIIVYGRRLTAEQAFDFGVVQKVTTSSNLVQEAIKLANEVTPEGVNLQRGIVQMMKEDTFDEIIQLINAKGTYSGARYKAQL